MIATEPTTQQTKADQLRKCAAWLARSDVRDRVLITVSDYQTRVILTPNDLRRSFPGAGAKQRIIEHRTIYSLEADGIAFEANDYARAEFQVTETEVTL